MSREPFDPVALEILWSRLIGIADDMWTTVLRTAVSTIIGSAHDFGCEILDTVGSSVAHAGRSMPVFNMVMPTVTRAVLARHPLETVRPGDVFVTNDPWLCAGHLDDIAVVAPVFHGGRAIAFATTVAHASSIGGALSSRMVRDVYEEGLRIPIVRLYQDGTRDETAAAFIAENVRQPDMVFADITAQTAANDLGATRLSQFLSEYDLPDLSVLAPVVQARAEAAIRNALRELPDGTYVSERQIDGSERPLTLRCAVRVTGDTITVDYNGSDMQQRVGGINCTLTYTRAHTVYPLQCLLCPHVPANDGTFRPITVVAPERSVLNCAPPAAVGARVRTGWHLHALLFDALADVLPERVQAGNGLMQLVRIHGERSTGEPFSTHFIAGGGRGASSSGDGVGRNSFPSSARNVAVEELEQRAPVLVWERALRSESAGDGRWCGAAGTTVEFGMAPAHTTSVDVFLDPDYVRFAPRGLAGGGDGGRFAITHNGRPVELDEIATGHFSLHDGENRLRLDFPGGGGYGHVDEVAGRGGAAGHRRDNEAGSES